MIWIYAQTLINSQHMAEKQHEKNKKLQKTEHIPNSDMSDEELFMRVWA